MIMYEGRYYNMSCNVSSSGTTREWCYRPEEASDCLDVELWEDPYRLLTKDGDIHNLIFTQAWKNETGTYSCSDKIIKVIVEGKSILIPGLPNLHPTGCLQSS